MEIETIRGMLKSNTFIVKHLDTTLIIDAGAPLSSLPADLKPNAILITHSHFDHVYCLDDYKNAYNCPVYNSTAIQDSLHSEGSYALLDEKEITIGKLKIKPYECPGHSPDSVVYLIEGCLFTGDVLFYCTIGRTDLMENGPELMQQSLKRLLNIKFNTAYHGHSKPSSYEEQQKNIQNFINKTT